MRKYVYCEGDGVWIEWVGSRVGGVREWIGVRVFGERGWVLCV